MKCIDPQDGASGLLPCTHRVTYAMRDSDHVWEPCGPQARIAT